MYHNSLINAVKQRIAELDAMLEVINKDEKKYSNTKGRLQVRKSKNRTMLYHRLPSGKEAYIRKENIDQAKNLAQKAYNEKMKAGAEREKEKLGRFLRKYQKYAIDSVQSEVSDARKSLIKPFLLTDAEYVEEWQNRPYEKMEVYSGVTTYTTERGEKVRSKSEKIIADKLYKLGIPYRYEQTLKLKSGIVVHPDFTVLNKKTRKEYYWEHFGMMDDQQYSEKMIKKLKTYSDNKILPGANLLLTFESKEQPLDTKTIDAIINKYLT